jgi:hypothetical protein
MASLSALPGAPFTRQCRSPAGPSADVVVIHEGSSVGEIAKNQLWRFRSFRNESRRIREILRRELGSEDERKFVFGPPGLRPHLLLHTTALMNVGRFDEWPCHKSRRASPGSSIRVRYRRCVCDSFCQPHELRLKLVDRGDPIGLQPARRPVGGTEDKGEFTSPFAGSTGYLL